MVTISWEEYNFEDGRTTSFKRSFPNRVKARRFLTHLDNTQSRMVNLGIPVSIQGITVDGHTASKWIRLFYRMEVMERKLKRVM